MPIRIYSGASDRIIEQIIEALRPYEAQHPRAEIDLYRHTPISVRVRIIDPDFAKRGRVERHESIWRCFDPLGDDIVGQIRSLVLITPREAARSGSNFQFEDTDATGWSPPLTASAREDPTAFTPISVREAPQGVSDPPPSRQRKA